MQRLARTASPNPRRLALLVLPLALAGLARAQVTIDGQPGSYPDLQSAVDAAVDGDVLRAQPGGYGPTTVQAKGLAILSTAGSGVHVNGALFVRDLAPDQQVLLRGVDATGVTAPASTPSAGGPALVLLDCEGPVSVEAGQFLGGDANSAEEFFRDGGPAVYVLRCPAVDLRDCVAIGGEGAYTGWGWQGGKGGVGLSLQQGGVSLHGCLVRGGEAGDAEESGGTGGRGVYLDEARLAAVDSTIEGGRGGTAWDNIQSCSGSGGLGIRHRAGSRALLRGTTLQGGAPGLPIDPTCPGFTGLPEYGAGVVLQRPDGGRRLVAPGEASASGPVTLEVLGQPGDLAWLGVAPRGGFVLRRQGAWSLASSWPVPTTFVGVLSGSGSLSVELPPPNLATWGGRLHLQARVRGAGGAWHWTDVRHVVLTP